ncbi:C4-dicarboxylate ABC transporter substrate-binding protein [Pseudorhizobium endolithicum]|uniref:C4-dicarboxylate ABC transporter substrate-binding protein n=1 Tax=Pseudorhizobium endolithicum TaxID=1191678 RepID=A0ABN7JYN4_9HYPH|nr:C4-dicarboxylate TRAP transporter substrate-binding protein [Pseudorhizobium endolithicum]CAD7049980.1 C4-dicarboxylate ABC transporter substrate-binding protein [Pseudorhizobium endolithicum]
MRRMLAFMTGIAALAATAADARELRIAPGAPPAHPSHSHLYSKLAELLPEVSGGALTAQILGPEVVGLGQMKDGLQSQLVEIGNLLPLYFPADLPNMSLAGELALSGREPHAMAAAMTEYMVTCDSCQEELKKFGVIYLGSGSSDVYALLTNRPVRTAEDVKGLRLRSGGAPFSRWAEHFGAVPANIGVGETFESMSQGVIDGSMASIGDLLSFRLVELVKNITFVPLGTYHATSDFTVASTTWESLSPEERKQLTTAANQANVTFTQRWGYEIAAEAKAAAEKAGIQFVEPDPELVKAVEAFAEADKETAAKVAQERFGFTDAAERVARFSELVEKWTGIVKDTGGDPEAIARRLDEEVWSRVDFATYGM